ENGTWAQAWNLDLTNRGLMNFLVVGKVSLIIILIFIIGVIQFIPDMTYGEMKNLNTGMEKIFLTLPLKNLFGLLKKITTNLSFYTCLSVWYIPQFSLKGSM